MSRTVYWSLILLVVFCPCLWVVQALAQTPSTEPVAGIRVHTPTVHALIHARVVVAAGRVLDKGTIVIRDGVLTAVGSQIPVPADARVWDLSGKTIYPGLIDSFAETALDPIATGTGATHWNQNISPQLQVADRHRSDLALNEKLRGQGITVRLLAPAGGIIKGMSCLVNTGDVPSSRAVIKREVAQHIRLTISRGRSRDQYPSSPMGAVALARQTLYDAQWYHQAWSAHRANRTLPRPEQNDALAALQDSLSQAG